MLRLRALALATLPFLLLTACSQAPKSAQLEPQPGSPNTIYVAGAAPNKAGHLYTLSEDFQYGYREEIGWQEYTQRFNVHRYDRNGNMVWEREAFSRTCLEDKVHGFDCAPSGVLGVATDTIGNAHSLVYSHDQGCESTYYRSESFVVTFSPSGKRLGMMSVENAMNFTVDGPGNIYTIGNNNVQEGDCEGYIEDTDPPYAEVLTKHGTKGASSWQRKLNVVTPHDVVVSSTGNVYVVGDTGWSRYNSSGTLVWTKAGGASFITIAGSNLYTLSGTTLRKFDGNGKQLWSRTLTGLKSPVMGDLTGDTLGNVYITGKVATTSAGRDVFVRKMSGSGSVVWTKTYGTSAYDDARGIATYNGSEVYVAGETQGVLSEANRSGSGGHLRKMDKSGNRVWTR